MKTRKIGLKNEKHYLFFVKKKRSIFTKVLGYNNHQSSLHSYSQSFAKIPWIHFFRKCKVSTKNLLRVWKFTSIYQQLFRESFLTLFDFDFTKKNPFYSSVKKNPSISRIFLIFDENKKQQNCRYIHSVEITGISSHAFLAQISWK